MVEYIELDNIVTDNEIFMLQVLKFFHDLDAHDMLWWRTDGEYAPITFFVQCSDVFAWATADVEEIEPGDVRLLQAAAKDIFALDPQGTQHYSYLAPLLFCARKRHQRPMPKMEIPEELKPLFDACGPERTSNDFLR